MSGAGRAKAIFAAARRRSRVLDHVLNMLEHYGNVQGNVLAGAVTYFGFLSFFPILALAFAVVGYLSQSLPGRAGLPRDRHPAGLPGHRDQRRRRQHDQHERDRALGEDVRRDHRLRRPRCMRVSGWVSGLRNALQAAFRVPPSEKRNFVVGKGVDLLVLAILGL